MPRTKFLQLAEVFERLEKTASSLAMIDILADFFPKISPEEAKISAYLLRGELAPAYENLEIGLADKMVARAIAKSENIKVEKVKLLYNKTGDLGLVVVSLREMSRRDKNLKLKSSVVRRPNIDFLTVKEVFEKLIEIARIGGEGSQDKKINLLADLFSKTSNLEAKYIIRTILGTLRLGVGEMTFLQGLAKAFGAGKKDKEILEYAFNVLSDLGEIACIVSESGIKKISEIKPKVGAPIRVMLSNRIQELEEIKDHISGLVSVEEKYDGERIQAHIKKTGETSLFSRRQDNITHQYPDIIDGLKKSFAGKEAIVEGEVVAYNEAKGKLLPFQVLMSRRRKHNIEEYVKKIPVRYFLFDLLYLDGKNYLKQPLKERRAVLERSFSDKGGKKINPINFGRYAITDDLSEIKSYFNDSIKRGAEGVMIKDYSGIYQAGSRGWLWIKFKKEYQKELADNFDLAVIGGLYGAGRRAKTYGSLLVAAYNPITNKYYSFTKVGTGFTDENLSRLMKMFEKYKLKEKHKSVETGMKPDVWFEPKIVMEISGAEITVSPIHTVAKDKIKTGGLALRFPKFLRWREDKSAENATTVEEIYNIYKMGVKK
ncbi:MAG: ATP-dependent DNA ligase [bacterium]|nr:ATP-dependent DNA ligase [bacterium]